MASHLWSIQGSFPTEWLLLCLANLGQTQLRLAATQKAITSLHNSSANGERLLKANMESVARRYRAKFAPRILVGGWTALCSAFTLLAFFGEGFSVSEQWLTLSITLLSLIYFFLVLNYRVIITEEQISAPVALLSLSKPHTLRLEVIQRLWSMRDIELGALQLCLEPRDQRNKPLFIRLDIVSWRLLFDLLPKLPPDVELSLEKRLWALVQKEHPDIAATRPFLANVTHPAARARLP